MLKDAELAFGATMTEGGTTKTLELDVRATVAPSALAAELSVRAQAELPPGPMETGLQAREVTIGTTGDPGGTVMPPPTAEMAIGSPAGEAPRVLLIPISAVVAFADNVTATVATTPSPIAVALSPDAMQV